MIYWLSITLIQLLVTIRLMLFFLMFMDQLHEALILLWRTVRLQKLYACLHFDLSPLPLSPSLSFSLSLSLFFLSPSPSLSSHFIITLESYYWWSTIKTWSFCSSWTADTVHSHSSRGTYVMSYNIMYLYILLRIVTCIVTCIVTYCYVLLCIVTYCYSIS